tara:strand:+ start:2112 stop:4220 length:2109 start_codon:yes stop_codon:yes gene_type:complete
MKRGVISILIICLSVDLAFSITNAAKIDSIVNNVENYAESVQKMRMIDEADLLIYVKSTPDNLVKAKIYNALCWKYFSTDPPESMKYAEMQYLLVEKLTNKEAVLYAYDNMAWLYNGFSDYEASIKFMLKALKVKESYGDSAGVSISLSGLASNYFKLNNFVLALNYFEQSLKIEQLAGRELLVAAAFANIGLCYVNLGEIDKGLKTYLKVVDFYEKNDNEIEAASTYGNIGLIYLDKRKDYDKALFYLKKAEKYHKQVQNVSSLASICGSLSKLYVAQNDFENALIYGEKAVKNANLSKSKSGVMAANDGLAFAYYKNKNYKLAYDHFKIAYDVKDTIFNFNSAQQIADMQTKYDTEKKEAHNLLLIIESELDKAKIEKKNTQQNLLLIVLILILFVVAYVIYSLQQKKKTNKLLLIKNDEISNQKEIIEEKNKDITDSINYAQRIQDAILPDLTVINKAYKTFVYYKPKDVIGGDFYWVKELGDKMFFAVVDCTGHGVPGALMSMVGYNSLNKIVEDLKIVDPAKILDELNKLVNFSFNKDNTIASNFVIKDGMDISICVIDRLTNKLEYAGAYNSLYLYRNKEHVIESIEPQMSNEISVFYETKSDKMKVGGGNNKKGYTSHSVQLLKNDTIYLFTDGYVDQFGGAKGKKFMYKPFKRMLLSIQSNSMEEQQKHIGTTFNQWKGDYTQLDDVCVMGVRI